jgi:ribose 5-phosphate isomerase RpiB
MDWLLDSRVFIDKGGAVVDFVVDDHVEVLFGIVLCHFGVGELFGFSHFVGIDVGGKV